MTSYKNRKITKSLKITENHKIDSETSHKIENVIISQGVPRAGFPKNFPLANARSHANFPLRKRDIYFRSAKIPKKKIC